MNELDALFDKNCKCPVCGQAFTTKRIRSRFIKLLESDTDFCPTYSPLENNPMLYSISVCPSCGYSYSDDFSPYFPPGTKEVIQKNVCSNWTPQNFSNNRTVLDAIKTFKLAVYCGILKKEKHVIIAGLYMKIAWLYRYINNNEQEKRFMKLAYREYNETYSVQDYQGTKVSEVRVLYLLGELSLRTGDIREAGRNFSKVIEQQKKTTENRIVELAKERWQEIRTAN